MKKFYAITIFVIIMYAAFGPRIYCGSYLTCTVLFDIATKNVSERNNKWPGSYTDVTKKFQNYALMHGMTDLKNILNDEDFKEGIAKNKNHEYFVERRKTIVVWYFLFFGISSNVLVIEYDKGENGKIQSAIVEHHMI